MYDNKFKTRLREARELKGKTQVGMAAAINIARQTYIDMEVGKTIPRIDRIHELAEELGVQPEWLAWGIDRSDRVSVDIVTINGVDYSPED